MSTETTCLCELYDVSVPLKQGLQAEMMVWFDVALYFCNIGFVEGILVFILYNKWVLKLAIYGNKSLLT